MNYRKKEVVNIIRFPAGFVEENRGLKDCCFEYKVLASTTSLDMEKNDIRGIDVKISDPSDIVTFVIEKCSDPTPLPLLGESVVYPQDQLAIGFVFDWRQYLATYGNGTYKISIEFTVSGVVGGYDEGIYDVQEYTIARANATSRIWTEFNSFSESTLIDRTNCNLKDSIRFNGFFGNRQPKTEIVQLSTTGRVVEKIKHQNLNEWNLSAWKLNIGETRRIIDQNLLDGDRHFISDHNRSNHDYIIFDKPVFLSDTPEMEYDVGTREAAIKATFGDRKQDKISYYNIQ